LLSRPRGPQARFQDDEPGDLDFGIPGDRINEPMRAETDEKRAVP
jgi:hypothetical protein